MKDDKKKNKTSAITCTPSVQVFQKPSVFPKAFSKKFNDRMMRQASEIFDCEVKVQPMDFSAKFKKRVLPESTNNMGASTGAMSLPGPGEGTTEIQALRNNFPELIIMPTFFLGGYAIGGTNNHGRRKACIVYPSQLDFYGMVRAIRICFGIKI